jgi:hypothetical protein
MAHLDGGNIDPREKAEVTPLRSTCWLDRAATFLRPRETAGVTPFHN